MLCMCSMGCVSDFDKRCVILCIPNSFQRLFRLYQRTKNRFIFSIECTEQIGKFINCWQLFTWVSTSNSKLQTNGKYIWASSIPYHLQFTFPHLLHHFHLFFFFHSILFIYSVRFPFTPCSMHTARVQNTHKFISWECVRSIFSQNKKISIRQNCWKFICSFIPHAPDMHAIQRIPNGMHQTWFKRRD